MTKKHPKDRAERRRLNSLKDLKVLLAPDLGEAFKAKGETHAVSVPHEDAKEELRSHQEEHQPRSVQGPFDAVPDGNKDDQR